MRVLLDSGTDAALPLKNAWTPVSLAAGAGWRYGTRDRRDSALIRLPAAQRELYDESRTLEAVKIAVEAGTDVNVLDEDGDTALHYVVDKGVLSVVAFLTESGADVNATNRHGQAPLTRSARRHPEVSAEVTQAIGDLLRTLTEITLLCAERPKPQKTGSAWMHLATLYRSRSLTGWARAEHALNKGDLPAARGLRHGLLRSWEKQRWCSRLDNAIVAAGSSSSSLPARPSRLPLAGRARAYRRVRSPTSITSPSRCRTPRQ